MFSVPGRASWLAARKVVTNAEAQASKVHAYQESKHTGLSCDRRIRSDGR